MSLLSTSHRVQYCEFLQAFQFQTAKSSVIRQRGASQNGCFKKQSAPNFPKNEHLPPDTHTDVCVSEVKNVRFFGKFNVLCFLETPAWRIVLLPYYRRSMISEQNIYMRHKKIHEMNSLSFIWKIPLHKTKTKNFKKHLTFLFPKKIF